MLRGHVLFVCALAAGLAMNVSAQDPAVKVKVELNPFGSFTITGDKVIGSGKKTGNSYSANEIKVLVNSLKTGMSLRDRHLREKLESTKYKYITVSNIKASGGEGTAEIKIHNVAKKISFQFKGSGPGKATATFKLNLKDYNLTGINYKNVGVEDEVEVTATVPYQ